LSEPSRAGEPLGQRAVAAARAFRLAAAPRAIERFGSGHIHDTFAVRCDGPGGSARYVLQRINAHVFRAPERVVENAVRVSAHLRQRLAARGEPDLERRALHWCEARSGGYVHRDDAQSIWRACALIEGTHTLDVVASPAQARAAGRAFGAFLAHMADLEPAALHEVIPGFHDLRRYARRLEEASAADRAGRAHACADELAAVRQAFVQYGPAWAALQGLPRRIVHADCKVNNVLLDVTSGEGICVIDLDTVMPGYSADDFGQLARGAACTADEDERDLARVGFDLARFEALTQGFLAGSAGLLAPAELAALADAPALSALEHAVRFLTDHLEGDVYFRVHRAGQNLDRARAQRRLLEEMRAGRGAIEEIVRTTARKDADTHRPTRSEG
jgi:Ser/Thr protein kinase RdoA (MazF antagonist)